MLHKIFSELTSKKKNIKDLFVKHQKIGEYYEKNKYHRNIDTYIIINNEL